MKNLATLPFFALLIAVTHLSMAQTPVLTLPNSGNTETFNGMGTTTALPSGWKITRSPNNYRTVVPWNTPSGQTYFDVDQVVSGYPILPGNDKRFNCYNATGVADNPNDPDRAVGLRMRPSDYSQSIVVKCTNTGYVNITEVSLSYDIEKYRYDINTAGTSVKFYYTLNPNAAFSETATNPTTHWVGIPNSEVRFWRDGNNSNPLATASSGSFPMYDDYPLPVGTYTKVNSSTPGDTTSFSGTSRSLAVTVTITGLMLQPNQDIYFAVNFSIGDPTNGGGNNAQNSQIYALDNFSIDQVLPVELISFNALYRDGMVKLTWRTATEANNYGFEVERSLDRGAWQNIGFVEGNGTVNSPRNYSYVDEADIAGVPVVYYRLRQIDRDGSFEYSPIVSVSLSSDSYLTLSSFPNPFNPSTNLQFALESPSTVVLRITDASGREVARLVDHDMLNSGLHTVSFDAASLGSGIYFAHLMTSYGTTSHKLILSR